MPGRLDIVKKSVPPNLIYRFDTIPVIVSAGYFVNIFRLILKFLWRDKRSRIANTILKDKNKVIELTFLISRLTITV